MIETDYIKELINFRNEPTINSLLNKLDEEVEPIKDSWVGKVANNKDPDKVGRCRIRIQGYYEGIDDDDLPWALPSPTFLGSYNGSFIVPQVGTLVYGHFDQGDENVPVYDGLAFHEANTKGLSDKDNDYPNTMVLFETDDNDSFSVNRNTGEISIKHRSGSIITLDEKGNLTISLDNLSVGGGNLTIDAKGDIKVDCDGDATVNAQGNVTVDGSKVTLGKNPSSQLCNNLTNCLICGSPHQIGNTNVFV